LKVCLWESFDAEQHTSKRVLSLSSKRRENTVCRLFFRKGSANRFSLSLSLPFFAKHKQQIGTFVLAFGLEHYMHHKYHSHHHDEAHQSEEERKNVGGHSPKEFSAETASLDEITKEMTRLRERVGELRKEGKHV